MADDWKRRLLGGLLVSTNLAESDGIRVITVRLFDCRTY